ncbi:hypothetical protein [Streptomyces hawaiiensis]|jgi:hypothetical protein
MVFVVAVDALGGPGEPWALGGPGEPWALATDSAVPMNPAVTVVG